MKMSTMPARASSGSFMVVPRNLMMPRTRLGVADAGDEERRAHHSPSGTSLSSSMIVTG